MLEFINHCIFFLLLVTFCDCYGQSNGRDMADRWTRPPKNQCNINCNHGKMVCYKGQNVHQCYLNCLGKTAEFDGPCSCRKCKNQPTSDVCGVNGKSYRNVCEANCRSVGLKCFDRCECCCDNMPNDEVCTVDGKRFKNRCEANCRGIKITECPKSCTCPYLYSPVCGHDGKTYDNYCLADCQNTGIKCYQKCPCHGTINDCQSCRLQKFDPVCGINGQTYYNKCMAKCNKVRIDCHHKCPCQNGPSIQTPSWGNSYDRCYKCKFLNSRPLCGIDGKTYQNKCMADCKGVKINCYEKCPCHRHVGPTWK